MIPIPRDEMILLLHEHGWGQGAMVGRNGDLCMTKALRACAGADGYLIEQIWERMGRGADWNDRVTFDDVIDWISNARPLTAADLEYTFGPQWPQVRRIVHRAALINVADRKRLAAAVADRSPVWSQRYWAAAGGDYWKASMQAAMDAADDALPNDFVEDYAWISGVTAAVVAVSHRLGPIDRDLLLLPWKTAMG